MSAIWNYFRTEKEAFTSEMDTPTIQLKAQTASQVATYPAHEVCHLRCDVISKGISNISSGTICVGDWGRANLFKGLKEPLSLIPPT